MHVVVSRVEYSCTVLRFLAATHSHRVCWVVCMFNVWRRQDDLLYNSTKWGLFMYEQDWLDTEYDNVLHLNTNASAGRTWLMQMGTGAARNDLTIQYCMSHCRHIMQSVEIPQVTKYVTQSCCSVLAYTMDEKCACVSLPAYPCIYMMCC